MKTRVINITFKQSFDVYIRRPSMWSNHFVVGKHRDVLIRLIDKE